MSDRKNWKQIKKKKRREYHHGDFTSAIMICSISLSSQQIIKQTKHA